MRLAKSGPFLFDTSAEGWFTRHNTIGGQRWIHEYLAYHPIHVSAVTVMERIRGYSLLWKRAEEPRKMEIEKARIAYIASLTHVAPLDTAVAVVAAEIMRMIPEPPSPRKRSHQGAESRQERLSRWRFDTMIAATALVNQLPLIHNNARDFEAIRGAIEATPERFPNLEALELIRCTSLSTP